MKGFTSGIMKVFLFPFRVLGMTASVTKKNIDFVHKQNNMEKRRQRELKSFSALQKRMRKHNDEIL